MDGRKPVMVAGIAFYLDHNRQEVVPMTPETASPYLRTDASPDKSPTKFSVKSPADV